MTDHRLPRRIDGVDLGRLTEWMDGEHLGAGPLTDVGLLAGGTQNILLQFRRAGELYVLRRPPINKRDNSDETMRREARVLAAIATSDVPHARLIAACPDVDVIGAAFYLMESVDGINPTVELPALLRGDAGQALRVRSGDGRRRGRHRRGRSRRRRAVRSRPSRRLPRTTGRTVAPPTRLVLGDRELRRARHPPRASAWPTGSTPTGRPPSAPG